MARKKAVDEIERQMMLDLELNDESPGENVCIVTHASERMEVLHYTHVLARAAPPSELDRLEWAWNMDQGSLNTDTRLNIHHLSMGLHSIFNRTQDNKPTGWFWLPADREILFKLRARYVYAQDIRAKPTQFYGQTARFQYRLVPFPDMKEAWGIRRYRNSRNTTFDAAQEGAVHQFYYPFQELGMITSHVPPHFVITNTGKKMQDFYQRFCSVEELSSTFSFLNFDERVSLQMVQEIYMAWMNPEFAIPKVFKSKKEADSQPSVLEPYSSQKPGRPPLHLGRPQESPGNQEHERHTKRSSPSRAGASGSIRPWDSSSNRTPNRTIDSDDDDDDADLGQEEEFNLQELQEGISVWAEDVWASNQDLVKRAGASLYGYPPVPLSPSIPTPETNSWLC